MLADRAAHFGASNRETLATRRSLALLLDAMADPSGRAMLHEMVAEQTRQLGARHEDTLQTKEELATLLGADAKEHRAAHALLAEVVAAHVR